MSERLRWMRLDRDAVVVRGPDAVSYLQGQLSQDVAALDVGGSAWSWLLQPAGKVDALVRVTRTGPEDLLVDVDDGYGETVLNRLLRFKLRTKADLAARRVGVLALRGTGAVEVAATWAAAATDVGDATDSLAALQPDPPIESLVVAVPALWPAGEEAADVVCDPGSVTIFPGDPIDPVDWEAERIAAGVPVMGAELTEKTIPAETGLVATTASFTKGCYTGQELVARIDSRGGNVPRHLRRLRSAAPLSAGDELTNAAGKVVGTVTSAAVHPEAGLVALAYVARSVAAGDAVGSPAGPVDILGLPAG